MGNYLRLRFLGFDLPASGLKMVKPVICLRLSNSSITGNFFKNWRGNSQTKWL
jgi:hypothetical protein